MNAAAETLAIGIQLLEGPGTSFRFEAGIHPARDSSLVTSGSHCILESLPARVRGEPERLIGSVVLEKADFSFETKWLLGLGHEFGGPLNPFDVFLLLLLQNLLLPLRQQLIARLLELSPVRICVREGFLVHYKLKRIRSEKYFGLLYRYHRVTVSLVCSK